jgi:hypothetical protein
MCHLIHCNSTNYNHIVERMKTIFNQNICYLLSASFISYFGIGITQMYSLIFIYEKTHSNFYASLQACAIFGSGIVASYLYARHFQHKNLLAVMLIVEILCSIAALVMTFNNQISILYYMLIVIYLLSGFSKPSFQTMLFRLCDQANHIKDINAMNSVLYTVSLAAGWLASPLLFNKISYSGLFTLNAATYLMSAGIILILILKLKNQKNSTIASQSETEKNEPILTNEIIKNNFGIYNFYLLVAVIGIIFASVNGLEMGIFRNLYHLTDTQIGIFFAIWILAGSLAGLSRHVHLVGSYSTRFLPKAAISLLTAATLFSFSNNITAGAGLYLICGFAYAYAEIISNNYIYLNIESESHPKYFGNKNLITNTVMLSILPVIGYLADIFSIAIAMLSSALICVIILIINHFFPRKIQTIQTD